MAHYVICSICKQRFDRDKYKAVLVSPRRYAHATCAGTLSEEETQEEKDKQELEEYIKKLFNLDRMDGKITLQIKKFMQDNPHYTYSGIRRTLEYFYIVKKNPISKAQEHGPTIGIVPWVYDEAKRYYYEKWLLQQKNAEFKKEDLTPKIKEITIPVPTVKPKKRKIFRFLDEEDETNAK